MMRLPQTCMFYVTYDPSIGIKIVFVYQVQFSINYLFYFLKSLSKKQTKSVKLLVLTVVKAII